MEILLSDNNYLKGVANFIPIQHDMYYYKCGNFSYDLFVIKSYLPLCRDFVVNRKFELLVAVVNKNNVNLNESLIIY